MKLFSKRKRGKLYIVSGSSGSGKTTIMRRIMKSIFFILNEIVSITTRKPRLGEVNGVDYKYISKEEYRKLYDNGSLVNYTEYGGNYYGLTREDIETKLNKGNAFVIVDYQGMQQLKNLYPNSVTIFIYSSLQDSEIQMSSRGDALENIQKRLSTYHEEQKNRVHYDYVIKNTNGKLKDVIKVIKHIIKMEVNK